MNISEGFIRRPIGTSLLAAGLLLLGLVAYHFLPIAPLPQVDFPTISVSATQPGADPSTMASSVAAPLERRFGQIAGVSEITSSSSLGSTQVTIQFDLSRDINGAARDVQAAINAASGELPVGLPSPPTYRKINPADAPIMVLGLTSDLLPLSQVYNVADQILGQRLSQVSGVSQVNINGGAKSAVRVQVNPAALASMGLGMEDIRNVLAGVNVDSPKGSLSDARQSYVINSNDQLNSAADYRTIIAAQHGGTPVPLGSIAQVIDGQENDLMAGWFGTKRAVLLTIQKQAAANVIDITDQIHAMLPQLERWMPPSVHLAVLSDRTQTIRASVHDVQVTLMISIGLVILVMFLFLRRVWPTFIAGTAVPLSLTGTFGVMYLCGYSLDNLSLMALTVSVGFVVDDAIVVIENIVRFIEHGATPLEAALKGARQIGFTVISISISLVAVFIPILFMGGLIGRLFHEFAVTLSVAIVVSCIVSLTLTPMLCARFLKPEDPDRARGRFYETSERFFTGMLAVYERGLKWVLRHQTFTLWVALGVFVVTVWLYRIVPTGLFPSQDTGIMMAITEAAQDISFKAMSAKQQQAAAIIAADPAIATIGSFVGGGADNSGRMFISLKPIGERHISIDEVVARLRPKLARIEGLGVFLIPAQDIRAGGRSGKGQYVYALESADLAELQHWTPLLVNELRKYPQIKDLTTDQQLRGLQENIVIDRDAAARLGIQPDAIDAALNDAFGQRQVSVIYTQQNQYHVVLEADPRFQKEAVSLNQIYVKSSSGVEVPLNSVAHFEMGNTALSVNHQGQFPATSLTFNLDPGTSLGQATAIIQKAANDLHLPGTIIGSFQGTAKVFQASQSSQPLLLLTAVVAVYIVLGVLYESLVHPLTILSTLPSAGLGALLGLLFMGDDLSLVAMIGIILLIGIVKKNSIMMVDFALEAEREEGLSPEEAIYQACVVRFRPIMMTTMAALLGALPLAIGMGVGSELRKPLGVAIVGGLLVSQALTLFTTPVVYLAIEKLRQRYTRRKPRPAPSADKARLRPLEA
jgi:hydrophobe/amphiphile efflux-1 (HAE1) family protein